MKVDYDEATPSWEDSHRYGPAPRWRRRVLIRMINKLKIKTACDVGCAQPFLMLDMYRLGGGKLEISGCDISKPVIETNAKLYPGMKFFCCDLNEPLGKGRKKYDLVTCSEVIEHLENYQMAVKNICAMSRKYVLITVPSGRRYPTDIKLGHLRHYEPDMLVDLLKENGFRALKVMRTGFPIFSVFKWLVNFLSRFTGIADTYLANNYGLVQRFVATCVYLTFYLNIFPFGNQLIILAKKQ